MTVRRKTVSGMRQWLGNLLVAWTFISGAALMLGAAWYTRTGDIAVLIAYLAGPFLLGLALFMTVGIVHAVGRVKEPEATVAPGKGHRKRNSFGRR